MSNLKRKLSSPPRLLPEKRPNPTSSPSDPNHWKEAISDSTDPVYSDEVLAKLDRNLPREQFWDRSMNNFAEAMMEEFPSHPELIPKLPDSLPPGCTWGYYIPGSGVRSYVVRMQCLLCGKAHLEEDCKEKDTPEALEYGRSNFPLLSKLRGDETSPRAKFLNNQSFGRQC